MEGYPEMEMRRARHPDVGQIVSPTKPIGGISWLRDRRPIHRTDRAAEACARSPENQSSKQKLPTTRVNSTYEGKHHDLPISFGNTRPRKYSDEPNMYKAYIKIVKVDI
jgi:hypothetical protein